MKNVGKTIKNPRITEKASVLSESNVYVFDVTESANKTEVKKAIFTLYKVKPVKVNIINSADKKTSLRGRFSSVKEGGKKAMVYLKKGDKIEFV